MYNKNMTEEKLFIVKYVDSTPACLCDMEMICSPRISNGDIYGWTIVGFVGDGIPENVKSYTGRWFSKGEIVSDVNGDGETIEEMDNNNFMSRIGL